ncbi:hypothetical protein TNCV_2885661 [Trichonephila clavipes]|nr:hypothetical protein TNCV_2885661 [Trichonephila clavipes]
MGKAAVLSEFEKGPIAMVLRLAASFSETSQLVGYTWPAVFSTFVQWINDKENSSRHLAVGLPTIINLHLTMFKIKRSITISPRVAEQYNVNFHSLTQQQTGECLAW